MCGLVSEMASAPPVPVVLVRCSPGSPAGERVLEHIAGEPALVFFHADGVEFAERANLDRLVDVPPASELLVCSGSWRRRSDEPVPAPFRAGTLAMLFARLVPASGPRPQLICFGRGDD